MIRVLDEFACDEFACIGFYRKTFGLAAVRRCPSEGLTRVYLETLEAAFNKGLSQSASLDRQGRRPHDHALGRCVAAL